MNIKERAREGLFTANLWRKQKKLQINAKVDRLRDIDPQQARHWIMSSALLNLVVAASFIEPIDFPTPNPVNVAFQGAEATPTVPQTTTTTPLPPTEPVAPPLPFSQKPFPLQLPPEDAVRPPEPEPISIPWLPDTITPWKDMIIESAKRHNIDPEFLSILILYESGGHSEARSPAGALGLTQLMPQTAANIAKRRGGGEYNPFDPAWNIDAGAEYIAERLHSTAFASPDPIRTMQLSVIAYHSGDRAAEAFRDGVNVLGPQGRLYKELVPAMYVQRHDAQSPAFVTWMTQYGGEAFVQKARDFQVAKGIRPAA